MRQMEQETKTVLIVEDDVFTAKYFEATIQRLGYETCGPATTADEAVEIARDRRPSMIFMDFRLRGVGDGADAALEIYEFLQVPTVFVTGSDDPRSLERIRSDHPARIITKPVDTDQFRDVLSEFCPLAADC